MTIRRCFLLTSALLLAVAVLPASSQTFREVTGSIWGPGVDQGHPCVVDVDGDGMLDLILGTASGAVNRYEQPAAGAPAFAMAARDFLALNSVDAETAPTATDLDNDGLIDLIVGCNGGTFFHYEQTAARSYGFALRNRTFSGIDAGAHSACAIADVDGDGRLEMFVTESSGPIALYKQNAPGDTLFTLRNAAAVPKRENYQHLLLSDLDGDGLFDLLSTDDAGTIFRLRQVEAAKDSFALAEEAFLGLTECRFTAMAVADLNGDGRKELLLASPSGRIEARVQAAATSLDFATVVSENLLQTAENGSLGSTTVTDIDGDGLLDLISTMPSYYGARRRLVRHEQTASGSTDFAFADSLTGPTCERYTFPYFVDLDGNGRLDLLLGTRQATIQRYEQDAVGSTSFTLRNALFCNIDLPGNSLVCSTADIDGDGLLDLFCAVSGGSVHHYRQAAPHDTTFVPVSTSFAGSNKTFYPHLTFVKNTASGIHTLYLGLTNGWISRFEQDAPQSLAFTQKSQLFGGINVIDYAQPNAADVNRDGLADLIIGDQCCGVTLFLAEPETGADPLPAGNGALAASCHPNPCAARTAISLHGAAGADATLALYDMLGRSVHTASVTLPASGRHSFTVDAGSLAPGNYLYVVRSGGERATGILVAQQGGRP